MRLSKATFAGAFHQAPKVQDVALVTSQSDDAVSDFVTSRLMGLWRKKGVRFASMDFPKAMKIEHDMIDPSQKNQQTDIVYPVLVKTFERPLKALGLESLFGEIIVKRCSLCSHGNGSK